MEKFSRKTMKLPTSSAFKNGPDLINMRTACDFWQWAFSDLLQNTTRGILAEYIVAVLLGADDIPRNPWKAYDLKLSNGMSVEVKTMSLLQAWAQKQLSEPKIVLAPKRYWDPETGVMEKTPSLNADLYVICYFNATDHSSVDPLNLRQWEFFAFTKSHVQKLLARRKSISLRYLQKLGIESIKANNLKSEVIRLSNQEIHCDDSFTIT